MLKTSSWRTQPAIEFSSPLSVLALPTDVAERLIREGVRTIGALTYVTDDELARWCVDARCVDGALMDVGMTRTDAKMVSDASLPDEEC